MKLIVGLGNPEEEYANTRHNMGFDTVNKLAKEYNIELNKKKFDAIYGMGDIEDEKVVILKPQTYMNLSGESVIKVVNFYKIKIDDIVVVFDDMDIEPGIIKLRKKGGTSGHNGMKSVVENLKTENFARVRVGIGKPNFKGDKINYVIGKIPEDEQKVLNDATNVAKDAVVEIIKNGIDIAMNKFN